MIRYALACACGHEYDAWFGSSSDHDDQSARGLIACPACDGTDVRKQVMAPSVATARRRAAAAEKHARAIAESAGRMRKYIAANFDDVGDRFPEVARAIHLGESPERPVYGEATPEEAEALRDEGVQVAPLPPILSPAFDKKVN